MYNKLSLVRVDILFVIRILVTQPSNIYVLHKKNAFTLNVKANKFFCFFPKETESCKERDWTRDGNAILWVQSGSSAQALIRAEWGQGG